MKKNVYFAPLFPLNLALITHNAPLSVNPSILETERLIIHVCGQSRHKHGAVIRIAGLKGNRIISY